MRLIQRPPRTMRTNDATGNKDYFQNALLTINLRVNLQPTFAKLLIVCPYHNTHRTILRNATEALVYQYRYIVGKCKHLAVVSPFLAAPHCGQRLVA